MAGWQGLGMCFSPVIALALAENGQPFPVAQGLRSGRGARVAEMDRAATSVVSPDNAPHGPVVTESGCGSAVGGEAASEGLCDSIGRLVLPSAPATVRGISLSSVKPEIVEPDDIRWLAGAADRKPGIHGNYRIEHEDC